MNTAENITAETKVYGKYPVFIDRFPIDLQEVMYFLYLPVRLRNSPVRLPPNLECVRELVLRADAHAMRYYRRYKYVYVSARKGYATPDNPLNRPGWHCDGFGSDDINFVWWQGPGTRFAVQSFDGICSDHNRSMKQFEEQVKPECVITYPEYGLYLIDPSVVHATPVIEAPGCMRQYVKISMSDHEYNLENNSHNYLFDYSWPLHSRDILRNDPYRAQLDYVA